jgi:hypothetical protein
MSEQFIARLCFLMSQKFPFQRMLSETSIHMQT